MSVEVSCDWLNWRSYHVTQMLGVIFSESIKYLHYLTNTQRNCKHSSKDWKRFCKDKFLLFWVTRQTFSHHGNVNFDYRFKDRKGRDGKGWEQMDKRLTTSLSGKTRDGGRKNWWTVTVWQIRPLLDVLILNREWLMDLLNFHFI